METEKITEAVKDEEFAKSIIDMKSPEEVKKAFAKKEVEISLNEAQVIISTIEKMVSKGSTELSEEDLEEIAGGRSASITERLSLPLAAAIKRIVAGASSLNKLYNSCKEK